MRNSLTLISVTVCLVWISNISVCSEEAMAEHFCQFRQRANQIDPVHSRHFDIGQIQIHLRIAIVAALMPILGGYTPHFDVLPGYKYKTKFSYYVSKHKNFVVSINIFTKNRATDARALSPCWKIFCYNSGTIAPHRASCSRSAGTSMSPTDILRHTAMAAARIKQRSVKNYVRLSVFHVLPNYVCVKLLLV